MRINESNTSNPSLMLSPHNSVFQLLNNPELGSLSKVNSRNVCDSPDLSDPQPASLHPQLSINEFSSWHMVPQNSQNSQSSHNLANSRPSSILSSSDADDTEKSPPYIIDTNQFTHKPRPQYQHIHNIDRVLVFDSESGANSDEEDLKTELEEDSSTVNLLEKLQMPSFIMPKMSMVESSAGVGGSNGSDDKLKVSIVGKGSSQLINRLNLYNKILQNVNFHNGNPDLIVLIIDQDNLLLSQQFSRPFIPIFIMSSDGDDSEHDIEQDLNSTMSLSMSKICQPIKLKSLDDDLFYLINVLSSVDISIFHKKRLGTGEPLARGQDLTKNSHVINTKDSELLKKSKKLKKNKKNGKKNRKLLDSLVTFLTKNSSTLITSLGYLGVCYYGVSFLLSKRKSAAGASPDTVTDSVDLVPTSNCPIDNVSDNLYDITIKKSIAAGSLNDLKFLSETHLLNIWSKFENLLDSLLQRGKLTTCWLYYNFIVICD